MCDVGVERCLLDVSLKQVSCSRKLWIGAASATLVLLIVAHLLTLSWGAKFCPTSHMPDLRRLCGCRPYSVDVDLEDGLHTRTRHTVAGRPTDVVALPAESPMVRSLGTLTTFAVDWVARPYPRSQ